MFTLQARLLLSCQGQTTSVVVLWGPEVLSTSLSEAGGARLTVTTSACQGLKPNGLALEGLISLHPGWTKRNLGNDKAHSLLLALSYLISPDLKESKQLLICHVWKPPMPSAHTLPPPAFCCRYFEAQRIFDRKLESQGCGSENNAGWPCHLPSQRHAQKTSLWASAAKTLPQQGSGDNVTYCVRWWGWEAHLRIKREAVSSHSFFSVASFARCSTWRD